jgi:TolB-like protein/cytochrome c-type biogenesis protein CcmH/NrfG
VTDTPAERGAESTWARLRRRKVVQWGVVYVAAAWGFLQGLEYLSGTYDWPRQIQQYATLVLLIGVPIVLVVAYYHGNRGQQRISTPELAILTLLLLLGGGVFWYYQRANEAGSDAAAMASTARLDAAPTVSDARPSVAVLPFENRSREADDVFFVDGIHDDILTQLSKISALRVISRTSVEQFRDTKLSMKAIAEQLGVAKILEGGVQRAGDRVRVTVQLIDAPTDSHLWAENYDRELSAANIFAIQSEVASAIAGALKTSLTAGEQARLDVIPTRSLEAWQAYQLGKQRLSRRTSAALAEAEEFFRKAVAIDPKFALAWAGLADTLTLQPQYTGRPGDAAFADAEQAVTRALELDLNLAEGWASAGLLASNRLQYERGEQMLRRAIALNPNYAPAHHWLSTILLSDRHEALAEVERAVALDPLSGVINTHLGAARMDVGRFEDALVAHRQAIEIDPTMANAYSGIGDVHAYGFGRFDTAMAWYEKASGVDPGNPAMSASVAFANWQLDNDREAARWLDRMLAVGEGTAFTNFVAALLYLSRGDDAAARKYAQRAAELGPWFMPLVVEHDIRKGDYASARARYAKAFPDLFAEELPKLEFRHTFAAIDLALVLQHTREEERASALLDRSEALLRTIPRMGLLGYGFWDVALYTLRGQTAMALIKLREAEQAGCRLQWRCHRDFNPSLASIRNEAEFKAVFADIERDMAQQRARLAARRKDAPLELAETATTH